MYKNRNLMYNKFATTRIDVFYNTPVECSGQREYFNKGATTMGKFQDLTGQRFNRLTAIKYLGKHKWLCKCDCGKITEVIRNNLVFGHTKSCGCLRHKYPDLKNDKTYERLYNLWRMMIRRCNTTYKNKNITVCSEWKYFPNFYYWSINSGFDINKSWKEQSIDRINNNGNYEPNNCRFISIQEQQRNKGDNINITYKNETHCIAEWAEVLNINDSKFRRLLYKNFTIEEIIKKEEANG